MTDTDVDIVSRDNYASYVAYLDSLGIHPLMLRCWPGSTPTARAWPG